MTDLHKSRSGRRLLAAIEEVKREHGSSGLHDKLIVSLETLASDMAPEAVEAPSPGKIQAQQVAERSTPADLAGQPPVVEAKAPDEKKPRLSTAEEWEKSAMSAVERITSAA